MSNSQHNLPSYLVQKHEFFYNSFDLDSVGSRSFFNHTVYVTVEDNVATFRYILNTIMQSWYTEKVVLTDGIDFDRVVRALSLKLLANELHNLKIMNNSGQSFA